MARQTSQNRPGWWVRHFGHTTRGRIAALLRRARLSIEELAAAIGVTDNAVRAQIATLQRDGIVRAVGVRRDGAVGKPATLYEISPEGSAVFSAAYAPVLAALVAELDAKLTASELRALMKRAGHRLAASSGSGSFDERVQRAAAILADLGADAELVRTNDGYEICGHGCPIAQAVASSPHACHAIEQLIADVTGARVREECDRTSAPNCRFRVARDR